MAGVPGLRLAAGQEPRGPGAPRGMFAVDSIESLPSKERDRGLQRGGPLPSEGGRGQAVGLELPALQQSLELFGGAADRRPPVGELDVGALMSHDEGRDFRPEAFHEPGIVVDDRVLEIGHGNGEIRQRIARDCTDT